MNLREQAKYVTYRLPGVRRLMAPAYPYKVNPAELAAIIGFIDASAASGGAIVEVGVAQGDSSVFFLEHLRSVGDERRLTLMDTFSGFTSDAVDVEVKMRGKAREEFDKFRYGDRDRFERNLKNLGFSAFDIVEGDASKFEWPSLGSVGAMLLDVDLYAPTLEILEKVYPILAPGGGIVVDDCLANTPWDGSLQAYEEFIEAHGLPFERVGRKGAIVRRVDG